MKAARLHAYGKSLAIEEVPRPEPSWGETLVRVEDAGFCHTDIHVIDGEIPIVPRFPLTGC
jgi:alcohol dehydrogenase, propanol-preferring